MLCLWSQILTCGFRNGFQIPHQDKERGGGRERGREKEGKREKEGGTEGPSEGKNLETNYFL